MISHGGSGSISLGPCVPDIPTTGCIVGEDGFVYDDIVDYLDTQIVPEPSAAVLLVPTMALLGMIRRKLA